MCGLGSTKCPEYFETQNQNLPIKNAVVSIGHLKLRNLKKDNGSKSNKIPYFLEFAFFVIFDSSFLEFHFLPRSFN